ncbi:MAG TPA: GNAT family N-acetyltransferase [Gemmatimonadales bacterium]|nr:GNAT family N-acetyltransferase [Gemmatimonadales bacterium]
MTQGPRAAKATIERVSAQGLRSDTAWWRLYDASFPAAERDPAPVVLATAEPGVGFVLRASADGHTIGLAVAHLLRAAASTFVVYLAVDPDRRSLGVGRTLFEETVRRGAAELQAGGFTPAGAVWEIDDPSESVDPAELAIRLRRRTFFENLGGRALARRYIQPPIDGRTEVPMQLMFRPSTGASLPTAPETADVVRAIYFEKYHGMNGIPVGILERLLTSG